MENANQFTNGVTMPQEQYDPLMIRASDLPQTRTNQGLGVISYRDLSMERALDAPINPSLRGLLLDWLEHPAQAQLKELNRESLLFALRKKARSFNETRLPIRLPKGRADHIANTIVDAIQKGKIGLMRRAYFKEDILRNRDPEKYRLEQSRAGASSGRVRRKKNRDRDQWVIDAAKSGLPKTEIAKQDGRSRRMIYKILNRRTNP